MARCARRSRPFASRPFWYQPLVLAKPRKRGGRSGGSGNGEKGGLMDEPVGLGEQLKSLGALPLEPRWSAADLAFLPSCRTLSPAGPGPSPGPALERAGRAPPRCSKARPLPCAPTAGIFHNYPPTQLRCRSRSAGEELASRLLGPGKARAPRD